MALFLIAPAPFPSLAQEQPAAWTTSVPGVVLKGPNLPGESPKATPTLAELRSHLDKSDREVAMKVLEIALAQLGDGAKLAWKRPKNNLSGVVETISAFRDAQGRVCRKLRYSITLGDYFREVEGSACRENDGSWTLQS